MDEQKGKRKSLLHSLAEFVVFSNLWISIGAFSWTLSTQWIFDLPHSFYTPAFVGFATLFTYNFQRLLKLRYQPKRASLRNIWLGSHKKTITSFCLIGASGTAVLACFLSPASLWLMIPFGIISLGYALKFLPAKKGKLNLRDIPALKIVLISLTWAIPTVFLPLLNSPNQIGNEHFIFSLERVFFVIAITIPFDIRDLKYDSSSMKTMPQLLGIKGSLWLSVILLIICAGFDLWLLGLGTLSFASLIALYFSYCVAAWVITLTTHSRPELYFAGILDGLFLLQVLCLAPAYFQLPV